MNEENRDEKLCPNCGVGVIAERSACHNKIICPYCRGGGEFVAQVPASENDAQVNIPTTFKWSMLSPFRCWHNLTHRYRVWLKFLLLALAPFFIEIIYRRNGISLKVILTGYSLSFPLLWGFIFYQFVGPAKVSKGLVFKIFLYVLAVFFLVIIPLNRHPEFLAALIIASDFRSFFLFVLGVFLQYGLLEEIIKAVPVVYLIYKIKSVVNSRTIVFTAIVCGLIFGSAESMYYGKNIIALCSNPPFEGAAVAMFSRTFVTPALHGLWSGMFGIFAAIATHASPVIQKRFFIIGVLFSTILHGVNNFFALGDIFIASTVWLFVTIFLFVSYAKVLFDIEGAQSLIQKS